MTFSGRTPGRLGPGRILAGRFRLEGELGYGGTASVWRGRDLRLDRPVAVKVLRRSGFTDPAAVLRFAREARTVERLRHPNIVAGYATGTDDADPYLVLELVEGRSLADLLADGPLTVARCVDLARQTCAGLAAAHAAGIVHRDVKPANLLVTDDGTVKICDFGIAHVAPSGARSPLTAAGVVVGTVTYMSPEQAFGLDVDGRSDLYAVGCVLYAMLTGEPPFVRGEALDILRQHAGDPPAPLAGHRDDVPPALTALVAALLAKEPDHRPRDAGRVRDALAGILTALPRPETTLGTPARVGAGSARGIPGAVDTAGGAGVVGRAGGAGPVGAAGGPGLVGAASRVGAGDKASGPVGGGAAGSGGGRRGALADHAVVMWESATRAVTAQLAALVHDHWRGSWLADLEPPRSRPAPRGPLAPTRWRLAHLAALTPFPSRPSALGPPARSRLSRLRASVPEWWRPSRLQVVGAATIAVVALGILGVLGTGAHTPDSGLPATVPAGNAPAPAPTTASPAAPVVVPVVRPSAEQRKKETDRRKDKDDKGRDDGQPGGKKHGDRPGRS
ncbi:serine/threonine-protein kinase [Longispora sp. NPDC051575]|uniref:serine/threonine-protein kinase n=1 Tax=Longispora sp. NPDC051575 TaxID=3154943 RepID=UPI003437F2C3